MTRAEWNNRAFRKAYYQKHKDRLNARTLERYHEAKSSKPSVLAYCPSLGTRNGKGLYYL